ncbi:NAD(P)/FAD-dependent oxidoreductase [Acidisoma cellulosilytica]|uniref:NAD(P)/FAD-dependent oxidoreductase n=1 Tax=Acidisoma cellulosilyticum TaxID=2802395 RepID=A0A964E4J2_9PROT|nr:NAD(P)/FAD-dependent oxidoreductase [Acidisoma cellulosilyticum]MCB8881760.1 NAD(P)/FAD-dependent oxidoreductase [Acidisoma cellulosilyticum]
MNSHLHSADRQDVAVIGAGVVGCAIARRFALTGARVIVIEKAADILAGASKGNSAILHTGFDAPSGSLEWQCMQAGYAEFLDIRERLGLPLLRSTAILAAWTEDEMSKLDQIAAKAWKNGVTDVRPLSPAEVLAREPHLSRTLLGGLLVPGEFLIDPWSTPLAYLHQAIANGATVLRETEVLSGRFDGQAWTLETNRGAVLAETVINAAGLWGDVVDDRLQVGRTFDIRPRKGQFVVFDKAAARLLSAIILPVPTERTKGIVLTPTIFGNLLVGPTAEEQADRIHATVEQATLEQLIAKAQAILPALADMPVTATYAGLRPATAHSEYQIRHDAAHNLIVAGGIRSTGLTGALGIAQHVAKLYNERHPHKRPESNAIWPTVALPVLAEHEARDWTRPGYGEIVCHCELVTKREIEAALTGPLPAGDSSGLKRRTRAGMGRCQGFYCHARIASLTQGRFTTPLAIGSVDA